VSTERRSIDANSFGPADLAGLNDDQFRAVVDADLRRRAPNSGARLRQDLIAALRSPEHVARWHSMLSRMQKSVDGQLGARAADFRAEHARLEADVLRTADLAVREDLRRQQQTLRSKYQTARAATVRFKTGLDEATLEARHLRDQAVASTFGGAVMVERDHFASSYRRLCAAVERHRTAVMNDLGGDEPDEIDESLWGVMSPPTEPTPQNRGSNEANAGREHRIRRTDEHAGRLELVAPAET
jgi:hypothetical protein